jgi:hypothetical protein
MSSAVFASALGAIGAGAIGARRNFDFARDMGVDVGGGRVRN